MKRQTRCVIIGVVALTLVAAVALAGGNPAGPEQTLALQPPPFIQAAESIAAPPEVAALLSSEAGISAYLQTPGTIDLNLVRGEYRTIEADTSDYIIGSVAVPNYVEAFDVHVYVHKDGWLLAYYLAPDPASKIADVKGRTASTTKLETVLSVVAGAAGYSATNSQYYDFRFPNATHILMVAENHVDGRDFTIELPSEFGYWERSFSVYASATIGTAPRTDFYVDSVSIPRSYNASGVSYGWIAASQLLPGAPHYVSLASSTDSSPYGVLVITYRVP